MLFVYSCLDAYLADTGVLGFVITQTLFKTREAGDGFRRFTFTRRGKPVHIHPIRVIDMTELHPFEGATNRTASFLCNVSEARITWPIDYQVWTPKAGWNAQEDYTYAEIVQNTQRTLMEAIPMLKSATNSAWLTAPAACLKGLEKVMGTSQVKAHAGVCTWMNGVFWLRTVESVGRGKVRIENWSDVGKIRVDQVEAVIEENLVFPLLRGRDVHRWTARSSTHILLTQDPATRVGITEALMKRKYPLTYQYLRGFERLLRTRSGYRKYFDPSKDAFWTIYNVGEYTLAPFRVAFKELTDFFQCAVVPASSKPIVPDTKLRFIDCPSAGEAYFLCGLLNSSGRNRWPALGQPVTE